MFYSQIILAKKGPLGKVWQAAHWGDKKLGRPAIFATDISAVTDSIVHPAAPMALRVSGHLLLGVVRIYSRQVKFLLDDCQQAMVKVKMAYTAAEGGGSGGGGGAAGGGGTIDIAITTRPASSKHNALNVSNFGEFTDAADFTTTNFSIPLEEFLLQTGPDVDDEEDWVPAELDESTLNLPYVPYTAGGGAATTLDSAVHAADRTIDTTEEWGVFDPYDEEGEEEGDGIAGGTANPPRHGDDSTVSEIELTRAANESLTSDTVRRASVLQNDSLATANDVSVRGGSVSDGDFPLHGGGGGDIFGDDHGGVMMDDDDDENSSVRRKSLRLSLSRDDSTRGDAAAAGISFGDEDSPVHAKSKGSSTATTAKKRKSNENKKRRKRRKIVTDDGHTELSNDHIRAMLADTSDIVRQDIVHPATWIPGGDDDDDDPATKTSSFVKDNTQVLFAHLSHEQLFGRPALGDDGHLAPELLALWGRNCAPVLGKPFDYELVDHDEAAAAAAAADEEEEEDLETARHGGADSVEELPPANDDDDNGFPAGSGGGDPPFDDNDGGGIPFDDDEDNRVPQPDDDDMPGVDSPAGYSQRSMESIFSLGATNALDDVDFGDEVNDDEGDPDEATTTTTSKWHKNTLKVFDVLKKNLAPPADGSAANLLVSYNDLSEGVSRRTAAGFFFELLQLKTLNYIELDQDESYGDIKVSAGVKFLEDPPST